MNPVLYKLSSEIEKGKLLEEVAEAIFKDMNFTNIKRQKSGSQYGYDVVGYKDNQCWKAECKNLKKEASLNDIAPKLIWHIDSLNIDRFIVISINGISNDLNYLLEQKVFSFPIEVWSGEYLAELIYESPSALKVLGVEISGSYIKRNLSPLIFEPNNVIFDVYYSRGLPYAFDYFLSDHEVLKAYSEIDFRLSARIRNPTKKDIYIQEVKAKTLRYFPTGKQRVFRQRKFKGNISPLRLPFVPRTENQGEVSLNDGKIIEIKSDSTQLIEFTLSPKCQSGYYELIFEVNYILEGKYHSLYSPLFQLHKKYATNNMLELYVVGKYYDKAALAILNLEENSWRSAKKEFPKHIKYLGPTQYDITFGNYHSKTWTINLMKVKNTARDKEGVAIAKNTSLSKLLVNLEIPIEEKLFTKLDAINMFRY